MRIERDMTKKSDFVERSIRGALAFFKEAIFADETAGRNGLMQGLDPRVRLVTTALGLLLVLLTRSMTILAALYLLVLLLAMASRVGLGFFLKRTWIFIPLFSLLVAIPAIFSFVSPGETIASAGAFRVTRHGLLAAGTFIARVITSVSLAVLLSLTTRHFDLLKALRFFAVPQVFVMVLGMCYRYLYLFVEIVENTHRAIRSRVGSGIHHRKGQKVVAWNIAHLWMRSYALNEQVYQAMVARGFSGEPATLDHFQVRRRDWLWLLASAAGVALLGYAELQGIR